MLLQVGILVLSIIALYFGAELALEAAERIGKFFGLSPLVIGLLLIGFGTSLPEFFVSQLACMKGQSGIALGNIIGSNIANLFLIMGVSGLLSTLHILRQEIKIQLIIHVGLTAILTTILLVVGINYYSTGILLAFFSWYLWTTFSQMKKQRQVRHIEEDEEEVAELSIFVIVKLFFGFALLYFGGEWLVNSGTKIGDLMGISTYVISAIFVAFGTSFPELVTALIASYKKKNTDLITGNIIGSNIFNVAFVMGSLGFYNIKIETFFQTELIALWAASIFLLALALFKKNFNRLSGATFLGGYGYMVYHWL